MISKGVLVIEENASAKKIHELAHGYQHTDNGINIVFVGGQYVDISDEVLAYIRQYIFDPSFVENISGAGFIEDFTVISFGDVRGFMDANGVKAYADLPLEDQGNNED